MPLHHRHSHTDTGTGTGWLTNIEMFVLTRKAYLQKTVHSTLLKGYTEETNKHTNTYTQILCNLQTESAKGECSKKSLYMAKGKGGGVIENLNFYIMIL